MRRFHFNEIIEKAVPGMGVASLRHSIEAISLQAADSAHYEHQHRDEMRLAMIALSAHTERTSDRQYAGDQFQLAGLPSFHVEK